MDANRISPAGSSSVVVTAVDPGCSSVVSVGKRLLHACCDSGHIRDNSTAWKVRGVVYSKESGRTLLDERGLKIRGKMGGHFPIWSGRERLLWGHGEDLSFDHSLSVLLSGLMRL